MKRKTTCLILAFALCLAVPALSAESADLVWTVAPKAVAYDYVSIFGGNWCGWGEVDDQLTAFILDTGTGAVTSASAVYEGTAAEYAYCRLSLSGTDMFFVDHMYDLEYIDTQSVVKESQNRTIAVQNVTLQEDSDLEIDLKAVALAPKSEQPYYFPTDAFSYGKFAIYSNGKYVTDYVFDYVVGGNSVAFVFRNRKCALADRNGNLLTDFIYDNDSWNVVARDFAAVKSGTKWGFVDLSGKELIPPVFEEACVIDENTAFAKYNGKFGILDVKKTAAAMSAAADIPSAWAAEQVDAAIAAKLVPENLQSKYRQPATRAEFCALAVTLYETVTGVEITALKTFADTTDIHVRKMGGLGVVAGVGNDRFAPEDTLTREQAAVMLARLADALGKPLAKKAASFADTAKISSWATEQTGQVQAAGIMSGVGSNTFAPKELYTREQSILTMRLLYVLVK